MTFCLTIVQKNSTLALIFHNGDSSMLKQIGLSLVCLVGAMNASASAVNHALQSGVTLEYDLPPHDGQIFTNYMFWVVNAKCQITTEDATNDLLIEVLARKGSVNEMQLSQGESMKVVVSHGDILGLSADSGAKVKITNLGLHMVKASCST